MENVPSNVVKGRFGVRTKADDVCQHLRELAQQVESGEIPVPRVFMFITVGEGTTEEQIDSFGFTSGGSAEETNVFEMLGMLETTKLVLLDEAVPPPM